MSRERHYFAKRIGEDRGKKGGIYFKIYYMVNPLVPGVHLKVPHT